MPSKFATTAKTKVSDSNISKSVRKDDRKETDTAKPVKSILNRPTPQGGLFNMSFGKTKLNFGSPPVDSSPTSDVTVLGVENGLVEDPDPAEFSPPEIIEKNLTITLPPPTSPAPSSISEQKANLIEPVAPNPSTGKSASKFKVATKASPAPSDSQSMGSPRKDQVESDGRLEVDTIVVASGSPIHLITDDKSHENFDHQRVSKKTQITHEKEKATLHSSATLKEAMIKQQGKSSPPGVVEFEVVGSKSVNPTLKELSESTDSRLPPKLMSRADKKLRQLPSVNEIGSRAMVPLGDKNDPYLKQMLMTSISNQVKMLQGKLEKVKKEQQSYNRRSRFLKGIELADDLLDLSPRGFVLPPTPRVDLLAVKYAVRHVPASTQEATSSPTPVLFSPPAFKERRDLETILSELKQNNQLNTGKTVGNGLDEKSIGKAVPSEAVVVQPAKGEPSLLKYFSSLSPQSFTPVKEGSSQPPVTNEVLPSRLSPLIPQQTIGKSQASSFLTQSGAKIELDQQVDLRTRLPGLFREDLNLRPTRVREHLPSDPLLSKLLTNLDSDPSEVVYGPQCKTIQIQDEKCVYWEMVATCVSGSGRGWAVGFSWATPPEGNSQLGDFSTNDCIMFGYEGLIATATKATRLAVCSFPVSVGDVLSMVLCVTPPVTVTSRLNGSVIFETALTPDMGVEPKKLAQPLWPVVDLRGGLMTVKF